jgi:hypothetical protein
MPHVSTTSPRQFGLVLGGILHSPSSIWSRYADGPSPGPTIAGTAADVTRNPDRTGARVSCTGLAETTMTFSVPWGRLIMLRGQVPRDGRRILQTYSTLCSAFGARFAAHGSCDET